MSFHLRSLEQQENIYERTQRIYIDPQNLINLKKARKPLKMVASIYQPPQQTKQSQHQLSIQKSLVLSNNLISKKASFSQHQTSPYQKLQTLYELLGSQRVHPNLQFIWKLLPAGNKQIIEYQQGDCVIITPNDKYLVVEGQIKIIGHNQYSYQMTQGYLFFASNQTKSKILQIVSIRSTKLLKISLNTYTLYLKNNLMLKNFQKSKFIKFCPFFIWKNQLSQDLVSCIQTKHIQRQQIIYEHNQKPQYIYFVKQGIVLLERNKQIYSPLVNDYQMHYQRNQISQKDVILVVRKGMAFGLDGIIIKDKYITNNQNHNHISNHISNNISDKISDHISDHKLNDMSNDISNQIIEQAKVQQQNQLFLNQQQPKQRLIDQKDPNIQQNPQNQQLKSNKNRKNTRIYTAKSLGKCQLYVLDRKVLQTLFRLSDISPDLKVKQNPISQKQLQRISIECTNMLLNQHNVGYPQTSVKRKQIILKINSNIQAKKSNSVTFISKQLLDQQKVNKKSFSQLKNRKVDSKVLKKRSNSQQNLKNEIYLQESQQKMDLKNRIKQQRMKQLQLSIKKQKKQSTNKKTQSQAKYINKIYILPKIQKQSNKTIKKQQNENIQNSQNKIKDYLNAKKINDENKKYDKVKIEQLIHLKIKNQLSSNQSSKKQKINDLQKKSSKINQRINKQRSLVKNEKLQNDKKNSLLNSQASAISSNLQKINSKQPVFINIKSYKSIITSYECKY